MYAIIAGIVKLNTTTTNFKLPLPLPEQIISNIILVTPRSHSKGIDPFKKPLLGSNYRTVSSSG